MVADSVAEILRKEAMRRYPAGTLFKPLACSYCGIAESIGDFLIVSNGGIFISIVQPIYKNPMGELIVYMEGDWAEIVDPLAHAIVDTPSKDQEEKVDSSPKLPQKFTIPSKLTIVNEVFTVIQEPYRNGGSFNYADNTITVGTKLLEDQPAYVFEVLCHEIAEVIHVKVNTRYEATGSEKDYLFSQSHKEFENHISLLTGIIYHQLLV